MKKRQDLSQCQLYESMYAPVQTFTSRSKKIKSEETIFKQEVYNYKGKFVRGFKWLVGNTFGHFAGEWLFLAFIGILVALISYMIDRGALICNMSRLWLYRDLADHPWAKYFAWVSLPVCLIMFNAGFVKLVAPKVIGSGLPQVKTILRGVFIEDVLTFRALIAKVIGLIATLGSGMPLGKEGPLIQISCCCVNLLGKFVSFQEIYQNESRKVEMFAAAAAVGVGCTFGAPIGGVLLSVEITTAYYGVRNYWRAFCAAVWGTTVYRLLLVWIEGTESVTVVFKTSFFVDTPFAAQELLAFAILGIICGVAGAFYIQMKIKYGRFLKTSKAISAIKKANFFIYPGFVALAVSSINFPLGIGKYVEGQLPYGAQVINMFSNFSWSDPHHTVAQEAILNNWRTKETGFYLHLVCVIAFNFVCSIVASTMPIPCGSFAPVFRMGAASGRILGELMYTWYPTGLSYYGRVTKIIPGGYATVGAAALTGATTQTMSVAVIVFEMTSQITHTLPILIAVLISNSISQLLGPSIYNLAIKSNNLPYLPDLLPNNSAVYNIYVEDFMVTDFKFIFHGMSFEKLKEILLQDKKLKSLPLVDDPVRMVLLGSIQRQQLINLIERHVGKQSRTEVIQESEVDKYIDEKFTLNPLYEPTALDQPVRKRVCDLPPKVQRKWISDRMKESIHFGSCNIDPAPFQLVERTSLLKVHTLFSMVGVHTAYVTSIGKLIGLVGLGELRQAIQDAKNGTLQPHHIQIVISGDH